MRADDLKGLVPRGDRHPQSLPTSHSRAITPAWSLVVATRKLRLGPGSEIVCQSVTIRRNSVLNR